MNGSGPLEICRDAESFEHRLNFSYGVMLEMFSKHEAVQHSRKRCFHSLLDAFHIRFQIVDTNRIALLEVTVCKIQANSAKADDGYTITSPPLLTGPPKWKSFHGISVDLCEAELLVLLFQITLSLT